MNSSLSPLAGKPAPDTLLVDLGRLEREYYQRQPDLANLSQRVSFGTSGHRDSSLRGTFAETHIHTRLDVPGSAKQKAALLKLSPEAVEESQLAGEPITGRLTRAPGNHAPTGGLKVLANNGWFAALRNREHPEIYAESLISQQHLDTIIAEARRIVDNALASTARDKPL